MSRELLAGAGKVPVGAIANKKDSSQSQSLRKGQTLHIIGGGLPIDNAKSVVKNIHQENAQHLGKDVTNAKAWGTCKNVQNQKSWQGGTHPRQSRREHYEVERTHHSCGHSHCSGPESDYELHEDTVQIVYNTNNAQTNIKFDEINNSQALGDLSLSNRAGKSITQRFKLDSGACANLHTLLCVL